MTNTPAPSFPAPDLTAVNDRNIAIYRFGNENSTRHPLVLIHGWPELAYSWKNQLAALAKAGFYGIALDLPGFGHSDPLDTIDDYSLDALTGRLAVLCASLGYEKAIFCGHDWGGPVAWGMGVLQSDSVAGIIAVCTPHLPTPPAPPVSILKKRFGANHYIVRFQDKDQPEDSFTGQEKDFFRFMFRKPVPRELWPRLVPDIFDLQTRFAHKGAIADTDLVMSPDDIAYYAKAYARSGFTGGINLYRNIDENWRTMRARDLTLTIPCLWIGASLDLFLPPESAEKMDALCTDLEKHIIDGCGHWVSWQEPDRLNALLINWLEHRFA